MDQEPAPLADATVHDPSADSRTPKSYDRAYFERWYRGPEAPKGDAELRRSVAMAVSTAESVLGREIRSVLDVGAGEGRWQPVLREMRPEVSYLGIEPSEWAIERWGDERNLMQGDLESLSAFDFEDPFDLVVCADVLHYLDSETLLVHLDELADLVGGAAFLETFTDADPIHGDRNGFHERPAIWYRRAFEGAGLVSIGMQMWVHREVAAEMDALELPPGAGSG